METRTDSTRSLTDDELEHCLNHLEHSDPRAPTYIRNYLIFLLMADAGLRVSELCQLRLKDLHFQGSTLHSLALTAEITKGHRARIVPLTRRTIDALSVYLREQGSRMGDERSLAFPGRDDPARPLSARSVEKWLEKLGTLVLGKHLHPHLLRHTFGTRMLRVTNIRVVQELLGHMDIRSTQVYTHPDATDLQKAVAKLNTPPV